IDADRHLGADLRNCAREIGEAAAIQYVVGGECDNLAARAIDPDLRVYFECVPLDAHLKLLIAAIGKPDRTIRQEYPRQRNPQRERGMIASDESATDIGKLSVHARRRDGSAGFAE